MASAVLAGPTAARSWGQEAPSNIEVLNGIGAAQLTEIMEATSASLGVECTHCHVDGDYASDAVGAKRRAREMMGMVIAMSEPGRGTFELLESPSCWTCHRGSTQPPIRPVSDPVRASVPDAFSTSTERAGDVYANLTVFDDIPANQLREIMTEFGTALGVGCDHCHVPGNWAADDRIEKLMARVMADMRWNLEASFFMGRTAVTCWTCHRGETMPATSLPSALLP